MSTATAVKPWLSGFCTPGNPTESHRRCDEHPRADGVPCSCEHHGAGEVPTTRTGLVYALDETSYHGDRDSLSASGMKTILKAPALYHWELDHPRDDTDAFDLGHCAHAKVLGVGAELVVVKADSWSTKAAKEAREEARSAGKVALLAKDAARVDVMAEKVLAHPLASRLLTGGKSEVSAYWHDPKWDVTRRARFDHHTDGVIADLKTTVNAHPAKLAKTVLDYGYDISAAQYLDIAAGCDLDIEAFALIFVEKAAPHLITVAEIDRDFVARGRRLCAAALERYRDCRESGIWPGYIGPDDFTTLTAPTWALRNEESA